jgi:transposase
MNNYRITMLKGNPEHQGSEIQPTLHVGIDMHKVSWHVTIIKGEMEVFHGTIPGSWQALHRLLERHLVGCRKVQVVYEAGYFGFWLHDRLVAYGAECLVTPPSLIPQESGNRVKTDPRDSRKLALLLSKGLLKRVWVPTPEQREERQVLRRRRQLVHDRVRVQCRIKAELRFFGIELPDIKGKWTVSYVDNLRKVRFSSTSKWGQESFHRLLDEYDFLTNQIKRQTALVTELSMTERFRERVAILRTAPGIGIIAAMEVLVELGDVARFRNAKQLAAYVGLTPSQYSTGDHIRLGHITRTGKAPLRAILVEASWRLIAKDPFMKRKYAGLCARRGAKRAICAVARILLLRLRHLLLKNEPYVVGLAA